MNKQKTIAIFLAITIAASIFVSVSSVAFALTTPTVRIWTNPPDIIGLNQPMRIAGRVLPAPRAEGTEGGYDERYEDYTFTITKPDGTTEIKYFEYSLMNNAEQYFDYVPDQLGIYSCVLSFPGDQWTEAGVSDPVTWTVQTQMVDYEKVKTYCYAAVLPQTIGLGQYIYIVGWINPPPDLFSDLYPDTTFVITKPNGATETVVREVTNSEATTSFSLPCDQLGTWSVVMSWAGDPVRDPCTSEATTWTVQEEAIPAWPDQPLPTGPLTFPIHEENREWYQISGPWIQNYYDPGRSFFNPYSDGPDSAHILYTLAQDDAGLIGGEAGHLGSYSSGPTPSCAAHGMFFDTWSTRYDDFGNDIGTHPVLQARDMRTGELVYETHLPLKGSGANMGIEWDARLKIDVKVSEEPQTPAYSLWVWGGGLCEVEPWTGRTLYVNEDISPSWYYDQHFFIGNYPSSGQMSRWDPRSKEIVWTMDENPGLYFIADDVMIAVARPTGGMINGQTISGTYINTWDATTGQKLVTQTSSPAIYYTPQRLTTAAYGKVFMNNIDMRARAFDARTGEVVWTSEPNEDPWGVYSMYTSSAAYGNYYMGSYDGYMRCIDAETGQLKWKYYSGDTTEMPTGSYPWWGDAVIADNKLYAATGEHTTPNPLPRGHTLFCLDALNGDHIWSISGFKEGAGLIHAGVLLYTNNYDGQLYAFGKGESATTVQASPKVVGKGGSVMIEGTVTDQSQGAKDTPAISDASMTEWMQYLYMQKPMPTDATGVQVMLQAMRSDGSVIDIGWATSDIMGHYEYLWTPPDQDTYKVLATFVGSNSYYMSSAETALGVTAASSPGGPIEPEPVEPTEALITTEIAIIAAVAVAAVIGVAAYWALRKRQNK